MKFDDVDAESGVDPSWAIKRHASERTKSKVWYGLLGITVTALTGTLILRSSSIPCTLRQDLFQHYDKVLEPIDDPNKNISVNAGWEFAGYPTFANNQCGGTPWLRGGQNPENCVNSNIGSINGFGGDGRGTWRICLYAQVNCGGLPVINLNGGQVACIPTGGARSLRVRNLNVAC